MTVEPPVTNVLPSPDAELTKGLEVPPGHHFIGVTPAGQIISGTSSVTEWTEEDGEVYKETPEDQAHRAAEHRAVVRRWKVELTRQGLLGRRRLQPPPRRRPVQRPRTRRHAARRAAGIRSGADPGGDEPEPPPGLGLALFRALTPSLTGASRLRLFHALPRGVQERCWRGLERAVAWRPA